jgi:hypothetical protein
VISGLKLKAKETITSTDEEYIKAKGTQSEKTHTAD